MNWNVVCNVIITDIVYIFVVFLEYNLFHMSTLTSHRVLKQVSRNFEQGHE
jgi:hypothetical protein